MKQEVVIQGGQQFSQIVFSNNFEGVLHVLFSPQSQIEKTCIIHHTIDPLIRFETKLVNSLNLQLLSLGYFSHGIRRLNYLHEYIKPIQIYWGKDIRIVLGQKSPYQNLMELLRSNLFYPSESLRLLILKMNQEDFDIEFSQLIKSLDRELYFKGMAAGEKKLIQQLSIKKGIFPILRQVLKWYKELSEHPFDLSELFLFPFLDSKNYQKELSNSKYLNLLKILMPYVYLETELFTQDLLQDAQKLGAKVYFSNGVKWNLQGHKIQSIQLTNASLQLTAKKYTDATLGIQTKSLQGLSLPNNVILAKQYHFELSERVNTPVLICLSHYQSLKHPWFLGPILFTIGNDLYLYSLVYLSW